MWSNGTGPISVADARANLSHTLRRFRADADAEPVVLGSHRKPEAVLLPYAQYARLAEETPVRRSGLEGLRARKELIRRLAALSRMSHVAVFGSIARGQETADSDIDLLVDPAPDATYFDIARFAEDMEQLLGRHVDVVSRSALNARTDRAALSEAIDL